MPHNQVILMSSPPSPFFQQHILKAAKRNHVTFAFCVEKTPGEVIFTKAIVWKHFNEFE